MYQVTFSVHREFLEELKKNKDHLQLGIVRTSGSYRSRPSLPLKDVHYVASAVVSDEAGPQFLIALDEFCGQSMGFDPRNDTATARLSEIGEAVEAVITELGLDHRHGVIEVAAK